MTDFNKGDFTQQGIGGHVNAKVRLNAKRYLDIDLTSNEEASGCTIAGHVYDSLNDITYPIGSAPSGNIEITENTAEPLDIAQYATATVNVAGSGGVDLATMEVTLNNESEQLLMVSILNIQDGYLDSEHDIAGGSNATLIVPIRKTVPPIPDGPVFYVASFTGQNMQLTNNNTLNNCTLTTISRGAEIHVTDPTQPATAVIGITSAGIS